MDKLLSAFQRGDVHYVVSFLLGVMFAVSCYVILTAIGVQTFDNIMEGKFLSVYNHGIIVICIVYTLLNFGGK